MQNSTYSEASGQILLLIPYNWKPYLEHKENVSSEVRTILEQFEEKVKELKTALDKNPVPLDFQEATNLVLLMLKGAK
jgi:thiamine kinase-like enzyme